MSWTDLCGGSTLCVLLRRYAVVTQAAWKHRHAMLGPPRMADEHAFLPARLSLQETPIHPAPRRAAWAICTAFALAVAWSWFGEVDIIAVAPGRLMVNERTKTVQPLESGVVRAIHVRDGDAVQAGQLLIELDATVPQADRQRLEEERRAAVSESVRSRILRKAMDKGRLPSRPNAPELDAGAEQQTLAHLKAEWLDIRAKLDKLEAEHDRRDAEVETARAVQAKLQATVPLSRQREADYLALSAQGFLAGHAGQDRTRERIEQERDLAAAAARIQEAKAARKEASRAKSAFQAETIRQLRDREAQALLKLKQLDEEERKAELRHQLTRLSAPVAGRVQQLSVHTTGGVVTPAQALMVIVPDGAPLSAEVLIANKDIGFVRPGQHAEVKLETFPYTRFGTLRATVRHVSADVIRAEDRTSIDQRAAAPSDTAFGAALQLEQSAISVGNREVPLAPGMVVSAEIKTGHRRVLSFLLDPVREMAGEAFVER
ncbi:HlyD family type I secretion periplasmic adaptor subunit [Ideonella sp. 4Y11]|uniref:Membrane fusion protein (MFP) family protein n=1 Tax=Ideonella aquatica TaxID=2824119 RepID=A0A940YKY5_9BURK|nr:HlyD family type I secretion periplasmic adaptor subunit [Ideonella aquatica]MBQ0961479.1 HlyD family type I secretion periplasmic adaptor subunit [Ideonella aquatica]